MPSITLIIALVALLATTHAKKVPCEVEFLRVTGRENYYAWICNDFRTNPSSVIARVQADAPQPANSSPQRMRRIVKCFDDARRHDAHLQNCCTNPEGWKHLATATAEKCIADSARPLEDAKTAWRYDTRQCVTLFASLLSKDVKAGVWVCKCKQPGIVLRPRKPVFQVVSGRAEFIVRKPTEEARKEVSFVQRCSQGARKRMEAVCRNNPEDFETNALHLLQVCCKRARSLSTKSKFECAAIVPKDLNVLKAPFL